MHQRRGFTVIELLLAIAVLAILAFAIVAGTSSVRVRSRDANRRESMEGYRVSMEQYKAAKGTYFVTSGTCVQQGTAQQSGKAVYIQATGAGCTGLYGGGSGRVTRRVSTTNVNYSTLSIADALVKEGYLSRIYTDPLDLSQTYAEHSDHDFVITLCQSNSQPALAPSQAKEFGIYGQLEGTSPKENGIARQLCGGPDTASGGWEYWLASYDADFVNHQFASEGNTAATVLPAPVGYSAALPSVAINGVQAYYDTLTGTVKGSFTAENQDSVAVGQMYFTASLFDDSDTGYEQEVVQVKASELLSLSGKEHQGFTFVIPASASQLGKGQYYVAVRGWTQTGLPFANGVQKIGFPADSVGFIDIDTAKAQLFRDGLVIPPRASAAFSPLEQVKASFTAHNNSSQSQTVKPHVQVYARAVIPGQAPLVEEDLPTFQLAPNSAQTQEITLPKQTSPESYLAKVQLYNAANQPVSGIQWYQWSVQGVSGKILNAKLSGAQFLSRTVLTATVQVVGPADKSIVHDAHLTLKVMSKDGKSELFSDQQTIPALTGEPQTLTFPVEFKSGLFSVNDLVVDATLADQDAAVLNHFSAPYQVNLHRPVPPYYFVLPVLLILLLLIFFIYRRHAAHSLHYMRPSVLGIALLAGLLLSLPHQAFATAVNGVQTVGCNAVPVENGNPAVCSSVWNSNDYPQLGIQRTFNKTVLAQGDTLTVTVTFALDPANNGTALGNLSAYPVASNSDCVDAINFSNTNVDGLWIKSITAGQPGTTDVNTQVDSAPTTECWGANSCQIDSVRTDTITCTASNGTPTPTPTPSNTVPPTFSPPSSQFGVGSKLY